MFSLFPVSLLSPVSLLLFLCVLEDGTRSLTHTKQNFCPALYLICLLPPVPHPHFSLTPQLFQFHIFIFILKPVASSFLSAPPSAHLSSAPPFSSHHLACSCVPALGDPLLIHHYFHGYLAGFSVRSGRLESREVIECLYACREGLDYRDFESLGKGMKV